MRVGLLSTARINRAILDGARESERVEVVAVASRDAPRASEYAREHGLARAYGSYEELLADPEVDAVYISLPNSLHVEWSIRALEAGKHVLCEKPLTRRPEEAELAFDVAQRTGRVLAEAFMYRHHPQMRRVRELVEGGAIGALHAIGAMFSFDLTDETDVRLRADLDGGSLMDVGCYCISGARLLAGEPESVYGEQVRSSSGVDRDFHGVLRFPGDVVAMIHSSFGLPKQQALAAFGDEGTLVVQAPWRVDWGGGVLLNGEPVEVEDANPYRLELEDLAAAAAGERESLLGREDAVAQARALAALYEAAGSRRAVAP